jgi:leucyl-tRNA---protein transferase
MDSRHRRLDALNRLAFYPSPSHPCSYLPGRRARTLFGDPAARLDARLYSLLADYGYRRSGDYLYRPACQTCDACIPVRIPVQDFEPRRADRRVWRRNADLQVQRVPAGYSEEHFALYCRYVHTRHRDGGMDHPDPEQYVTFLTCVWMDPYVYEFRLAGRLLAAAVVDPLDQGLSAVYTYFDPDVTGRSLGTYAILWQIREAQRLALPWVYLGYWIKDCGKMAYKGRFRPLEVYREGRWLRIGPGEDLPD